MTVDILLEVHNWNSAKQFGEEQRTKTQELATLLYRCEFDIMLALGALAQMEGRKRGGVDNSSVVRVKGSPGRGGDPGPN